MKTKINDRLTLNVDGGYVHNCTNGTQTIVKTQANNSTTLIPDTKTYSDLGALKSVFTSYMNGSKMEYGFETTYTRFQQKYNVENNDYVGILKSERQRIKTIGSQYFC